MSIKHECAHCKATLNFLILQVNKEGNYELRCELHTKEDWRTVGAIDRQIAVQPVQRART